MGAGGGEALVKEARLVGIVLCFAASICTPWVFLGLFTSHFNICSDLPDCLEVALCVKALQSSVGWEELLVLSYLLWEPTKHAAAKTAKLLSYRYSP